MEPSTLTLNAQLTTFVAGITPPNLIGRRLAPLTPARIISGLTFYWWKFLAADYLRKRDTKVGRLGQVPIADFGYSTESGSLVDHGQRIIHPNDVVAINEQRPAEVMQVPINVRMAKSRALVENFWLQHEYEVRDLLFTLTNYSSAYRRAAVAGDLFDDPDNDPLVVIQEMLDTPLIPPNTLAMGLEVWRQLQVHPKVVARLKAVLGGQAAIGGQVSTEELRQFFGLRAVEVGDQRGNETAQGATAAYTRIWGKHIAAIRVEESPSSTEAPYGGTAITAFGTVMSATPAFVASRQLPAGEYGLYGATEDLVGHTRKVMMIVQDSGFLITGIVS